MFEGEIRSLKWGRDAARSWPQYGLKNDHSRESQISFENEAPKEGGGDVSVGAATHLNIF